MNPQTLTTSPIRNVAIIAHVDHGKTTLVDGLLKQAGTFRDNQAEMFKTTILDTGDLERERGITIQAKSAALTWDGHKINIIDTPGHADFSGEVERTLGMADGCLLIVDASEGPMPQTRFVLTKALELGLQPVVIINKVDKADADPAHVVSQLEHLFLDLAVSDDQLDFPVFYAIGRDGKAWDHVPSPQEIESPGTLEPIFHAITESIPAPTGDPSSPFRMQISSLDWDSYRGKYAVGRVDRGVLAPGQPLALVMPGKEPISVKVDSLFVASGLGRSQVDSVGPGDIAYVTGISGASIGATLADPQAPDALPAIHIESPTLQIAVSPNSSPFSGREGKFTTSRQIGARLTRELETNVSLQVQDLGTSFVVSGRGELHLSVLIETLRREGFELEVGRPQVVTRQIDGRTHEPVELLTIEVTSEHGGAVSSELGRRRAELVSSEPTVKQTMRFEYRLPTRATLGLRGQLLTATKGTSTINSQLSGYAPETPALPTLRSGALISAETGTATTYSLKTVEERGTAFIGPGTAVYEGMIIGLNRRSEDMEINVTKEKKLTNVRASATDMTTQLTPYTKLSLEEALDFIEPDECLEITPQNVRMRKRYLTQLERKRHRD